MDVLLHEDDTVSHEKSLLAWISRQLVSASSAPMSIGVVALFNLLAWLKSKIPRIPNVQAANILIQVALLYICEMTLGNLPSFTWNKGLRCPVYSLTTSVYVLEIGMKRNEPDT